MAHTFKFTFDVDANGKFQGEATPGTYSMIYRQSDTPKGQMVDEIKNVKIVAGQDLEQIDDMSRQEYITKMTPEQKKQLDEIKKQNSEALKANQVIIQAQLRPQGRLAGQARHRYRHAGCGAAAWRRRHQGQRRDKS